MVAERTIPQNYTNLRAGTLLDMHGRVAEDRATYKVSAQYQTELGDGRFDAIPRAYNRALKTAGLTGAERAVLDDILENTRLAYPPRETTTRAASIIAEACGISYVHTKRSLASLTERHILIQHSPNNPHLNHGATWAVNCDPTTWKAPRIIHEAVSKKIPRIIEDTTPGIIEDTTGRIINGHILETLHETKDETIKSSSSSAGAHEAIDISLDAKKEQLEDQAILDRLAATVPPEPVRYRPLPKTDQTRRNTTSPGNNPEPAFVAWREGFTTRYKHDPPRMSDDLRRLLLDLSREYPAVIDKVIRGYFGWTKLDEAEIRTKGLEETLEKECAACAGDPARSPFPPKAPARFSPSVMSPADGKIIGINPAPANSRAAQKQIVRGRTHHTFYDNRSEQP